MEEARGGNGYSYVGRNDSPEVPELQYEAPASARRPSWAPWARFQGAFEVVMIA